MSSYISKSKFEVSQSASTSPSPGFGLSLQTKVVTEICLELGCGFIDGVGGHTKCLRDGICLELQDGDIPSESEKVVEKGVPLHLPVESLVFPSKFLLPPVMEHPCSSSLASHLVTSSFPWVSYPSSFLPRPTVL